jgi:uncharacterized protein (DUF433 family)
MRYSVAFPFIPTMCAELPATSTRREARHPASALVDLRGMSKSPRPRKRKTSTLMIDTLAPSLFERSAAYLRRGLPPDATEFDRVCFQAMANLVWLHCPDVEHSDDTLSGDWRVKGTRVPVQGVLDNAADGFTTEQIATEIYVLDVDTVRRILAFAKGPT